MIKKYRHVFTTLLLLFITIIAFGQGATTSSMSGKIVDGQGEPLAGATILATHELSGTIYGATANNQGLFTIQGMRPGGPYKVEVSFIGYSKRTFTDINLLLGENYVFNADLTQESTELREVTVVGTKTSAFNTEKMGTTSHINRSEMLLMPSLNRSISDYTRLSPFATGTGSYLGRENYNTNVTVDGANFNNNFGLSGTNMPGVSGEPISMEAIEEIQVAVAPFDVRQSNFTGASVNAITRSGTNTYRGSVYGYYRDQTFNGKKIRDKELTVAESSKKVYGFTAGGPIIRNKLFFFLSAEKESTLTPGNTLLAMDAGRDPGDPNVNSRVQASDLRAFSQLLKDKFGYETGRYENWGGDNEFNNKFLAKIDWNITRDHKLTVRYNFSESATVSRPSNSGDARPSISGGRHARTGGMSYENSQYFSSNKLNSITGELNSRFGELSNKLLIAYTLYGQPRRTNSDIMPFIDIYDGTYTGSGTTQQGNVYMSAGYELFSYKNNVDNNTLILTDNVTYQIDKHNFTFGLSFEHQYFSNSYLRQGTAYYRFKDLDSFERYLNGEGEGQPFNTDYHPLNFAYTYPINGLTEPKSELSFGQFSTYIQDEYSVLDNLKVTGGLRIDLPVYFAGAVDNPALKEYSFRDGETVDLSTWPDVKVLWSPRLGFAWDVFNNKSLKIRGGTGIFTGRIPFVWFTNQPSNSGMIQYQLVINHGSSSNNAKLARIPFETDASQLLQNSAITDIFPTANPEGGRIASIDKDFRLPQVWRTSLGFDIKLPLEMMLTIEGIYTNDINAINFENINLQDAASTIVEGSNERPYMSNYSTRYMTSPYTDVVIMRNTGLGQGYSVSASLDIPRVAGFAGMIAYSKSWGEEVTGKSGSDPFSAWQYRVIKTWLNSEDMGLTFNNTPNRFIANLNYSIEYAKFLKSSLSVFYNGYQGNAFSYIYSGDANSDGTSNHELMYIPGSPDDFIWSSPIDAAYFTEFLYQDPYLKKHKGEYALRNGAYTPWTQRIDVRFMQEFKLKVYQSVNVLQFTVDVINFENLLNSSWGLDQSSVTNSPIIITGRDAATGKLKASMRKIGGKYVTKSFQDPTSVAGTWGIQLGLKYLFN